MSKTKNSPIKFFAGLTGLGFVCVLTIWLSFNAWTTVGVGEVKVGAVFGKVIPTPYTEGFHIVNPLASFERFDIKDQSVSWENLPIPSKDKLSSHMDVTVVYTLDASATPSMYSDVGTQAQMLSKHISPKVQSKLREAGKTIDNAQDLFTEATQQQLQTYMETGLREYLTPLGVNVSAVMFADIQMPSVVNEAVKRTKEAQELLERERATLEIVQQQEMQKVMKAEAVAKAAIETAKAVKINAEATAYATITEATAQANANELLSKSITPELVEYIRANNWNGILPSTMLGESANVLFNVAKR